MGGGRGGCLLLLTQVEPSLPTKFLTSENFVFSMKSEQKINFPTQADAEPGAACNDCCFESFLVQRQKRLFVKLVFAMFATLSIIDVAKEIMQLFDLMFQFFLFPSLISLARKC